MREVVWMEGFAARGLGMAEGGRVPIPIVRLHADRGIRVIGAADFHWKMADRWTVSQCERRVQDVDTHVNTGTEDGSLNRPSMRSGTIAGISGR